MEYIEELKTNLMQKIMNKEKMPEDILMIIKDTFDKMTEIYERLDCNSFIIQQYMEGQIEEAKAYLNNKVGTERQDEQLEQVQYVITRIQNNLEQEYNKQEQHREDKINKEQLSNVGSNNNQMTQKIMSVINDVIRDVQNRQNTILSYKRTSDERIEEIQQEVLWCIKRQESRNEEIIYTILQEDDKQLQEQLVNEYEKYLEEVRVKDKQDKFVGKIKVNISLEEQYENAIEFKNNKKDKN